MLVTKHNLLRIAALAAVWAGGCRSNDQPTTQAAKNTKPALTLIARDSLKWSREEACAKLADEKLGVSAAVRLVRLAEATPLCVPAELTDEHVRQLRLVRLSEQRWALGLADKQSEQRLRTPVLISTAGDVLLPAEGVDEELLVLCIAKDPDIFPHLLVLPERVLLIDEQIVPALVLDADQSVRFEPREHKGYPYIGLVLNRGGKLLEVDRYVWMTDELAFEGPAADKLPDPPGGIFRMDLKASKRFVPVGGQVPETKPIAPERPGGPVEDNADSGA